MLYLKYDEMEEINTMKIIKLIGISFFASILLTLTPTSVFASEVDPHQTEVGVYILKGDYPPIPPEPTPPSPIIHKDKIYPSGYLPKTGEAYQSYLVIGCLLVGIAGLIWVSIPIRNRRVRVSNEKL